MKEKILTRPSCVALKLQIKTLPKDLFLSAAAQIFVTVDWGMATSCAMALYDSMGEFAVAMMFSWRLLRLSLETLVAVNYEAYLQHLNFLSALVAEFPFW